MVGFLMLPASINSQQGVAAHTAFSEFQISTGNCEAQGTMLLGVPGAPPTAMFLLATIVVSSLDFVGNGS